MSPCQPPVLRRWLLPVVVVSIIAAACAGAGDAVGVDAGFTPPDACAAGEVPVEEANRPFVFLVCGRPYVDPMYPAPASWFGDGSGIEEVLGYLVAGTSGRAAELGLWSGFDTLTRAERDGISVEVEVSGSGVATIRLLAPDGADWRPPSELTARSLADWVMFTDVIAATALDFDHVGAVVLNVCANLGGETSCDPLQDTDMRVRHADWPIDSRACGLVDYWTNPECDPTPDN